MVESRETEFDAGGFAAIAAHFGKIEPDANDTADTRPTGGTVNASRRSGLGASARPKKSANDDLSEQTAKKILRVGAKKRRQSDGGSDDEVSDAIADESEDDEEEGRTSAFKDKPNRKEDSSHPETLDNDTSTTKKKKKKKVGKKERLAAKEAAKKAEEEGGTKEKTGEDDKNAKDGKDNEGAASKDDDQKTKKPKRRKVRSRQKNIRKDTRLVKPDHLIRGRENYAGRPMTPKTCEVLKIEKKTKDYSFQERSKTDVVGLALGVDDLLKEDEVATIEKLNKKGKKKKRKYKNL